MARMEESNNEQPDWLAIARQCVTAEDWAKIVAGAVTQASDPTDKDCAKSRDFLASIVLPQPKDRSDPTSSKVRTVRILLAEKPSGD